MAYVAPIHKATSIRQALRIRLLSPDIDDLVISKANVLEIWRLDEEGMACVHTTKFQGTIQMLQRLQPRGSETDMLFVGTDQFKFFSLVWNSESNRLDLVPGSIEDSSSQYMRRSLSQNKCVADPTGRFLALHLWEGVLNVLRLPTRKGSTTRLETLGQIRLAELWVKSSTFLHSRTGHPKIAFLHKSQLDKEDARLVIYRLTKDDKGSEIAKFDPNKDRELDVSIPDPYSSLLIPIPVEEEKRYHVRNNEGAKAHLGGILVVGETLLTYYDSLTYTSVSSRLKEPKIFVAWAEIDGTHYILADDYGRIDVLEIETTVEATGVVVTGMSLSALTYQGSAARTSRAASLTYLGDNMLFLASHHGDSQLFRIDALENTIMLVKSLSNNAPIMDFSVMDMGNREGDTQSGNAFNSGQSRIVAGCGAYQDGSLRSIRSGVGIEDIGLLDEIENTRGLFTLRSYNAEKYDTLVVSLVTETRIFTFDPDGDIEEVYAFQGMTLDAQTLLAANLPNGQLLQITPNTATLLDPESGVTLSSWAVPEGKTITTASANSQWALLSVDGTTLVSLNLQQSLAAQIEDAQHDSDSGQPDQISCIHAARDPPDIGVVGWWSSGRISLVNMATLQPIHGESMRQTSDSASVPRDIVLVQLHPPEMAGPTLLIALEDGNVVSFDVSTKGFQVSGRKKVTLGSSPARLNVLPKEDGTCSVFVTTEHSSLIFSDEGRIIYSATTADDATFVCPFDSEAFPDSVILSTDEHIRICRMDHKRLTHVKSLSVGETVRRVAYSPGLKAFGLGCIRKELVSNEEIVTSTFKLVDEIIFEELGKPFLLNASATLEMVETVIRAELLDSNGHLAERFIVGTSFIEDSEVQDADPTKGRILVLGVDEQREVYQILSYNLKGPCRCLATIGSNIVAGLAKTVIVYSYSEDTSSSGSIQKLAAYRPAAYPVAVDTVGNLIGVVDLMDSLSLVEFTPPQEGRKAKLEEKARHFEPVWGTSVSHLDEDRWLESDTYGNIYVLERNTETSIQEDAMKLLVTSEMNLGEQVNQIRKLNIAIDDNAIVSPRAFLGTTEGSLYMYGEISKQYQDLLMTFQSNLHRVLDSKHPCDFMEWRAHHNETRQSTDGPNRFIDGEYVEEYLRLDEEKQEQVCEGLGPSPEAMRNMIEELRRLH